MRLALIALPSLLCALLSALSVPAVAADLAAKTADGREVILREDGTWSFKPASVGHGVIVYGEKLTLGASIVVANYACKLIDGSRQSDGTVDYDCKVDAKPVRFTVGADGTLLGIEVASTNRTVIQAVSSAWLAGLGPRIGEEEIDGTDCPEGVSRYMASGVSISFIVHDGCYDEKAPTYTRAVRLLR